jgi:hypothetical protein
VVPAALRNLKLDATISREEAVAALLASDGLCLFRSYEESLALIAVDEFKGGFIRQAEIRQLLD